MERLEPYKAFFESSYDGIVVVDARGEIVFANHKTESLFKLKAEELIHDDISKIIPTDIYLACQHQYLQRSNAASPHNDAVPQEILLFRNDGIGFYVELSLNSIIKDEESFFVVTLRDISKYKKSESTLQETENRLRSIYALAKIGIWDWDIVTDQVTWSEEIYRIKGADPKMPATPFSEHEKYYTPESWNLIQAAVKKTIETGEVYQLDVDYIRSDGSIVNAHVNGGAKYDATGNFIGLYGTAQDVTAKKIAELLVLENESNLKAIIENTTDYIWAIDEDRKLIYLNNVFQIGFQRDWGIRLEKGMCILDVVPVEIREKWEPNFKEVFNNNRLEYESEIVIGDDKKYFNVALNPIILNDKVVGISVFASDISDRKRAENALRESESHLSQLVNASFEGIGISEGGVIVNANEPLAKMLGYDSTELIGKKVMDFVVPESHALVGQKLKEWNSESYQHLAIRKDGSLFPVEIHGRSLPYKNTTIRYTAIRDMSERMAVEMALRNSELKYRNIFENIQDLFFQTDMSGIIIEASPSMKAVSGFSREEVIGTSILDLYRHPSDRQIVLGQLQKNGRVIDQEIEFKSKSGNKLFVAINAVLTYDSDGKPQFIEGVGRDITARKNHELEISNQNKKLQLQNIELEQFTYVTSHDLQEPLRTLISVSNLIQEEYKGTLNEQADKYLEFIVRSATRMQDLVKGLLDFSRIGKEKSLTSVDCNVLLNEIVLDMSLAIEESKATLNVSELPVLDGYAVELRSLFQNLIGNALKFRIKGQAPILKISAQRQEREWLFSIQDNGIGIDDSDKDKIFIIFKRLHNRNDYEGTGIGLSHCKKIVELHGGTIWVDSKLGQGSVFNFTIPIL